VNGLGYLFGAYFVLWGVTFGYVFSIAARQKRVQQQLDLLHEKQRSAAKESR
jgi:CcmD family protein